MKPAKYRHQQGKTNCGCPSCVENICSCKYMASYDINGTILTPAGAGSLYWSNSSPPKYLHRFPCTFDITIAGFSNKTVAESWYSNIADINGQYVCNIHEACEERGLLDSFCLKTCNTVSQVLCSNAKPNGDFILLKSYLVVGIDDPEVLTDASVYPNGRGPSIIYHHSDYTGGSIELDDGSILVLNDGTILVTDYYLPQLYIWAITELYFNERAEHFGCECQSPYYFKTKVGEFNGDYWISAYGNPEIQIPESTDCGEKFYHGDFDGQYLQYTVDEGDLWIYDGTPINYASGPISRNVPRIGNFGTIEIKYRTTFDPYNMVSTDSTCNSSYPDGLILGATAYSEYPKYLTTTLGGVFSINPLPIEVGDKLACSGCPDFNTDYRLFYDRDEERYWITDPGHAHTVGVYTSELPEACPCDCFTHAYTAYYSGVCPQWLNIFVDYEYNADKTQYSHIIYGEVLGYYVTPFGVPVVDGVIARYANHVYDWRNIPTIAADYIPLDYTTTFLLNYEKPISYLTYPPPLGPCNFESSYLLVDFGECENIACVEKEEECSICHDRVGPDYIGVDIPNGWLDYDPKPYDIDCSYRHLFGEVDHSYILDKNAEQLYPQVGCSWGYISSLCLPTYYHDFSDCPCCTEVMYLDIFKNCEDVYDPTGVATPGLTFAAKPGGGVHYIWNAKNKIIIQLSIFFRFCYSMFQGNYPCADRIIFATAVDPLDYGTAIHCDPNALCSDMCDMTDISIVGGQYIDCRFNGLVLPFLGHFKVEYGCWWEIPIQWDGSPVVITSM